MISSESKAGHLSKLNLGLNSTRNDVRFVHVDEEEPLKHSGYAVTSKYTTDFLFTSFCSQIQVNFSNACLEYSCHLDIFVAYVVVVFVLFCWLGARPRNDV